MIGRRFFVAGMLLLPASTSAFAYQQPLSFWERLRRALGLGDRITRETVKAADALDKSSVPVSQRTGAVNELDRLSGAVFSLFGRRAVFQPELQRYLDDAKAGRIGETERKSRWAGVTDNLDELISATTTIQEILAESTVLRQQIGPALLNELSQSTAERLELFQVLESMPPPRTPEEIAELQSVADIYGVLFKRLGELGDSLDRARDRLTAA